MQKVEMTANKRENTGKGTARKLRREGMVPGVIYGPHRESQPLTVDPLEIREIIGENAIVELTILENDEEMETETAMLKDYQEHVIKNELLHVDFLAISMDEKITITVPTEVVGTSVGVKEGGVLQELMREVEIECYPADIPESIEVDITELDVGDSIQVSELDAGEEIEILHDPDDVLATVVPPSEEITEEEETLVDVETLEPEVIGEEEEEVEEELAEEEAEDEEDMEQRDYM
ncbi:50S ribosomal protein L25 [Halarsenatibacter silvermanii]|uniref:Large ribosomal subunit protein bL25 n=1 Tax=Halarsenatibacter silvermanii TaxID=321763 RepID=A0A1G9QDJ6_9FIRM|nr:50S ribosomal protein L25 [Halarsenatibacter silvermanii]SDM09056.1 large subunit ribosomal protein L25 [Halarsenatibacter silvermanii]